jgi:soluble lytic murein transglycosylase
LKLKHNNPNTNKFSFSSLFKETLNFIFCLVFLVINSNISYCKELTANQNKNISHSAKLTSKKNTKKTTTKIIGKNIKIDTKKTPPKIISQKIISQKIISQKIISQKIISQAPITRKLWKSVKIEELEVLKNTSLYLKQKNYQQALSEAKKLQGRSGFADALINVVLWNKYSDKIDPKQISFSDISRFANDNPFYPNIDEIKRNVERVAIANNVTYESSKQLLKSSPSNSDEFKLYLLKSKITALSQIADNDPQKSQLLKDIELLVADIWVNSDFKIDDETKFLNDYGNYLNQNYHINRINRLIWDNNFEDANRILNLVDEDHQRLFLAIAAIKNSPKYIDNIILSVPRRLRGNDNLTYHRILWYKNNDKIDDLIDLLKMVPSNVNHPEKWWNMRKLYTRQMLKDKNYKAAYIIAANHGLAVNSSGFWEAEWLSGWIALRFLDRPKDAYIHFENLYNNVSQPVTIARATYWLGMASEAMGDKQKAISWYKLATKYPIFFYGQLAIHKHRLLDSLNAQNDVILPKSPDITEDDTKNIALSPAAKVAYLMAVIGEKKAAAKIFEYIINDTKSDGEVAVVMKIANEINDPTLIIQVSQMAGRKNVFFIKDTFKIIKDQGNDPYAPLIHALIKQESAFDHTVISYAGAMGYMQLMPDTAKLVAKDIGVGYNKRRLITDRHYNVKLGSHYIKMLIDKFNGSELLAIASYNAGPIPTIRWTKEFYDPRQQKDLDKIVDWIELISYSQTRDYVQRVMENLIVYKYIMSRQNYDAIN